MQLSVLILFVVTAQVSDQEDWIEQGMVRKVFDLASDSKVRKELEISDRQLEKLRKVKAEFTNRLNRVNKETKSLPRKEAKQAQKKIWKEVHEWTIGELDQIFIRHQLQRLNQIARQEPVKIVAKGDRFKMYVIMARQLGLSDKEIAAFQKDVNKEKEEYQKKLEALTKETDRAVFKHLPPKTQAKVREVFGDIF